MSNKETANIIFIGKTGVGKSSFINYLFNKGVCDATTGEPVTQDFNEYIIENICDMPMKIIDSKGIEADDSSTQSNIIDFIKKGCNNEDIYKWIHCIFYCINFKNARFEDAEVKFIKKLKKEISQSINIIITHSDNDKADLQEEMKKDIIERLKDNNGELGNKFKIYFVNSIETKTRKNVTKPFGREKVLEGIYRTLWSDVSQKVAQKYAAIFRNHLMNASYAIRRNIKSKVIDKYSTIEIIKMFKNDEIDLDDTLGTEIENVFKQIEKNIEKDFQKYLLSRIEFFNSYNINSKYKIDIEDWKTVIDMESIFDSIDLEEILNHSKLGQFISEMDNLDDDSVFDCLKGIFKGLNHMAHIKGRILDIIDDICYEFRKAIPNEDVFTKIIYDKLMDGLHYRE